MSKAVVCFGEVLLRFTPPGHELLLQSPAMAATVAGAEANVAVALASFGHQARMATVLPDNALGHAALGELRKHGVDTRSVVFGAGRMGLFFLTPGAVRRPSEVLYDRADSAFAHAPQLCRVETAIGEAKWFHVSGVTPALGRACADAAIAAAKTARAQGVPVSFDGNYRSKLWEPWKDHAPAILRQLFENADIVFGDERDIGLVLGRTFAGEDRRVRAAAAAFEAFPRLKRIACTVRTPQSVDAQDYGAVMLTRNGAHFVADLELTGIVDRVGTGDAFAAGVIHGILSGMGDSQALAFGHAAACLKHSIPGDFLTLGLDAVRAALADDGLDVKR